MEKLLLSLSFVLAGLVSVNAQEVGQMWVGGSVGVWSSKTKGSSATTSYRIMPEFGYAVSDKLGVGIELGYAHKEENRSDDASGSVSKSKLNTFRVAPFVRLAVLQGDLGGLFVDAGAGYEQGKYSGGGAKTDAIDAGFKPGVSLNVSDSFALIGKFGFLGYKYGKDNGLKTNGFGLDFHMDKVQVGGVFKF